MGWTKLNASLLHKESHLYEPFCFVTEVRVYNSVADGVEICSLRLVTRKHTHTHTHNTIHNTQM